MRGRFIYWVSLLLGLILILAGMAFVLFGSELPAPFIQSTSSTLPSSSTAVPSTKLKVVVSIFPLADLVSNVGGEKVEIITLLPTGASPHTYEPTPGQVKEIAEAKVFVKNGFGLEFWAEKMVKAAANPGLIIVDTSEGISPIVSETDHQSVTEGVLADGTPWKLTEGGSRVEIGGMSYSVEALESQEELCKAEVCEAWHEIKQQMAAAGAEHSYGDNPHIWLDPVLAQQQVRSIAGALIQVDPANREVYERNEAQYLAELEALDKEIRDVVDTFSVREFICFHPAWTYFAKRYGLVEAAVIEVAPGKEASPAHIKEIVDTTKELRVKAIFAEPQFNPKIAEMIAEEAGVKVLLLDPLGGAKLNGRNSYIELMTYNLEQMKLAMGR